MARRQNRTSISRTGRGNTSTSNGTLHGRSIYSRDFYLSPSSTPYRRTVFRPALSMVQDFRTFDPTSSRPYRTYKKTSGLPVRTMASAARPNLKPRHLTYLSPVISFADAPRVITCIRRHQRREVLHALKIAGSAGLARPRRTWASSISCKG